MKDGGGEENVSKHRMKDGKETTTHDEARGGEGGEVR